MIGIVIFFIVCFPSLIPIPPKKLLNNAKNVNKNIKEKNMDITRFLKENKY